MDLCLALEQSLGSRVAKRWWFQDGLDLEGMRASAREVERAEGGGETYGTEMETETVTY